MQRTARTPDGRTLDIEEAGDPDGRPVLVHGGTPNSRHLYPPAAIDAAVRGLRLISYDRPGYGGSTPQGHGLSSFARQDGTVYHTYSAYARGCDALWGMWQWLDRAPLGRNEGDMSWFHRHDEYR